MSFNDLIYRDEVLAKKEVACGMHHCGYWEAVFKKFLTQNDQKTTPSHLMADAWHSGAHHFRFVDPATGKSYDVRVKPSGGSPT